MRNYGCAHYVGAQEVIDKSKQTRLERYGNETYNNKEKALATNLERYGYKAYNRKKGEQTRLERYGNPNYVNTEKAEQTCLERYGVRNYTQLGLSKGQYKWYDYALPSGNVIQYQGYEGKYIPILLRAYVEDGVVFKKADIPKIPYIKNGKNHVYFPDFYVPSKNLIIEVKSEYTLKADYEVNQMKFEAVVAAGYNFKLKVI